MTLADPETALMAAELDRCEKYLDRLLAKSEASKQELEKNWMGQITSVALSLALVVGLGRAVAHKLLDEPDQDRVLYVILPAVNTFLFVRFGLIAGTFSRARFNAQKLADEIAARRPFAIQFAHNAIYETNSYFEWAHQKYSSATMLFLLSIPLLFSLNHGLTIYLLYTSLGMSAPFLGLLALYIALCVTCYYKYYDGNKDNTPVSSGKTNLFIVATIVVAVCSTVAVLWGVQRFDM